VTSNGIILQKLVNNSELFSLDPHTSDVRALAYSPDGGQFATSDIDKIHIWDSETGEMIKTHKESEVGSHITDFVYHPNGTEFAYSSYRIRADIQGKPKLVGDIRLINAVTGEVRFSLNAGIVFDLAISSNGKHLAASFVDDPLAGETVSKLKIWNIENDKVVEKFTRENLGISTIASDFPHIS
jgi:WD40 repeat protein